MKKLFFDFCKSVLPILAWMLTVFLIVAVPTTLCLTPAVLYMAFTFFASVNVMLIIANIIVAFVLVAIGVLTIYWIIDKITDFITPYDASDKVEEYFQKKLDNCV